jgi:hypothetical protein
MALRQPINLRLAVDAIDALRERSELTGEPMSRIVDTAIRRTLGLPEPIPLLPVPPLQTGTGDAA